MKLFVRSQVYFTLLLSFFVSSLVAQTEYDPKLLIPYNDHGKWGFSDTLGNIKVAPQFESVSFFYEVNDIIVSYVSREGVSDYYIAGKGSASPIGAKSEGSFFQPFFKQNNLSVIKEKGRTGLFNYEKQELLVATDYKKMVVDQTNQTLYFYKYKEGTERNEMIILAYDVEQEKTRKLKYVQISSGAVLNEDKTDTREIILFKDKRGNWFENSEKGWVKSSYSYEDMIVMEIEDDERVLTAAFEESAPFRYSQAPDYQLSKIEGAKLYSSIQFGRSISYQVMWKDGRYGLFHRNTELLPFNYDFIDIDYNNGLFYLIKDNKMGVYMPNTTYPIIESKYGVIGVEKKLKVHKRWQFIVFNTVVNGEKAYLGESGVEYFNFD